MSDDIKLLLGCGRRRKAGWVNIDIDPKNKPDIVANISKLNHFKNETVSIIDSYHVFEHLFLNEANKAVREWYRILKKGGDLYIELPNLARCAEVILTSKNPREIELAMMGIYGFDKRVIFPNGEDKEPVFFQVHKYGWTPETITNLLKGAGFKNIKMTEPLQTFRPAYKINRDMRIHAKK